MSAYTAEQQMKQLLQEISESGRYRDSIFAESGIYFVIVNAEIRTISSDASCLPKGGWFPEIISGPSVEERECLEKMMNSWDFDIDFFDKMIEDCGEFCEEDALEYFEDNDDEDSAKIFWKMRRQVSAGKTPFESMEDLVSALTRFDLDGDLYYEWEGEYIHFFNNICDVGEAPGTYDNYSAEKWIEILENLEEHIVTA